MCSTIRRRPLPDGFFNPVIIVEAVVKDILTELYWVKGYSGVEFNDIVDTLAKDGSKESLKLSKDVTFKGKWIVYWSSTYKAKFTHCVYVHPSIDNKYMGCSISNYFLSTLVRMKFNHGYFPIHLHSQQ
ncbi:hypothetical protein Trydic_g16976 [Trypoxylus dichotomus]